MSWWQNRYMKKILTTYFICTSFYLMAQTTELKREIKYTAEVGTYISTDGNIPFWLRANQYGTVPLTSPIVTLGGSISSDYKKATTKEDQYKLSKFDWGYGLNIVGNVGKENQFLIPEAYIKAKFGAFEIYAGRRKEIVGLVDSTLSSGSYIWSGNALPMPKIQIMNRDFVPLGITKGFLSFKGSFAHGWFENDRTDVKNFYLHQKSLYFRLGKSDWKFKFYGGFNHQVQWGGELKYPDPDNLYAYKGKVGSSFNDYKNVILGKSLGAEGDTSKVGLNEATNRSGNHLGTIDFAFDLQVSNFSLLVYRQNIYDTGTLYFLSNITDGLNGFSITNKKYNQSVLHIRKICFEYTNTYSQGGEQNFSSTNDRLRGQVNYFNNAVYREGWVYNNRIIGTPFMTPVKESIYNYESTYGIGFNRFEAYFLGINLGIKNTVIESKLSYSQNYGFSGVNLLKKHINQFSGIVNIKFPVRFLDDSLLSCSVAYDKGELLNESIGIYVGVHKKW